MMMMMMMMTTRSDAKNAMHSEITDKSTMAKNKEGKQGRGKVPD